MTEPLTITSITLHTPQELLDRLAANSQHSLYGTQPGDDSEAEPIAVTDAMVSAARKFVGPAFAWADWQVEGIYRAMAAVEPLVPNLPARLIAERDAALARAEKAEKTGFDQAEQLSAFQRRVWDLEKRETMATAFGAATDEILLRTTRERDALLAAEDAREQATDVDRVIEQLDKRIIGAPERTKLRGALDKADAPDKSRNGQDAAVGRALRLGA